jgi:hypothetical protein
MMKNRFFILLFLCSFTAKAQKNNIILNGSFEQHNITDCYESMLDYQWNYTVSFSTSYGFRIEVLSDSCLYCTPLLFGEGGCKKEIGWLI